MTPRATDPTQGELEARGSLEFALCLLYPYVLQHDAPGERWASLLIEQTMKDVGAAWFCVEGMLADGTPQRRHDGQLPPFVVVDLAAHDCVPGEFATRSAAEDAMRSLVMERVRLRQARLPAEDLLNALADSNDYLRSIRAEELDGSEPALGELLERNGRLLASCGRPSADESYSPSGRPGPRPT